MTLVLGVDGGGTKTHVLIADAAGALLGAATGGITNWEDVGVESTGAALRAAVLEAAQSAGVSLGDIDSTTIGLAGVDWPSDLDRLGAIPESLGLGGRWEIVNDAFVALRAGANHPWGITVIAGSGSVVAGRSPDGTEFRTLGLGTTFGDFGGAADIAIEAIRCVAEAYTGLSPATTMTERFMEAYGVPTTAALLEHLSRADPRTDHLAPLVLAAAAEGDAAAKGLVERAGSSLGTAAGLVARRLGIESQTFEVVLAGGVIRAGDRQMLMALDRELHRAAPSATAVRLEVPPVVGAALRALEAVGETPSGPEHLRLSMESMKILEYEFA